MVTFMSGSFLRDGEKFPILAVYRAPWPPLVDHLPDGHVVVEKPDGLLDDHVVAEKPDGLLDDHVVSRSVRCGLYPIFMKMCANTYKSHVKFDGIFSRLGFLLFVS